MYIPSHQQNIPHQLTTNHLHFVFLAAQYIPRTSLASICTALCLLLIFKKKKKKSATIMNTTTNILKQEPPPPPPTHTHI